MDYCDIITCTFITPASTVAAAGKAFVLLHEAAVVMGGFELFALSDDVNPSSTIRFCTIFTNGNQCRKY